MWVGFWENRHAKASFCGSCDTGRHRRHTRVIRGRNRYLKKAEQTEQLPNFGPPRGKLTPAPAEALARELPDDRFVAEGFPPTRLIFPEGTQESYVSARVLKVVPLTGEQVLKAYAKDVPVDPDAAKSAPAVDESALVHLPVLGGRASGHSPWSSGRQASSAGMVASCL
jgi:hypothetical protein